MRLSQTDLDRITAFAELIGDPADAASLRVAIATGVQGLVACDVTAYTELWPGGAFSLTDPGDVLLPDANAILSRLRRQARERGPAAVRTRSR
jgi:hypothetical protein